MTKTRAGFSAIILLVIFLSLNFFALYLGTLFMANGPQSAWYLSLNKAPWTPPGWVFGAAWTAIMVCFSVFLTRLCYPKPTHCLNSILGIYGFSWILNVSWNYVFFNQHLTGWALVNLVALFICIIALFFHKQARLLSYWRYLLLPYIVWLGIAISLNAYVILYNG